MYALRILHVIDSGGFYGAEAVVLTLMEELTRLGHSPLLASLCEPGLDEKPIEAEALRRGRPFRRLEMGTLPGPGSVSRIFRLIREEQIDVVHTHGYKANVLFGLLPRFCRTFPLVSTLHGWCSTRQFSKLRLYEWLDSRVLGCHDGVAVVSARMLDLPALAGRKLPLLRVIPNATVVQVPTAGIAGAVDEIDTFCRQAFTFGSLGRLSTEKNFITLLEAFEHLQSKGLDGQLLIMGEGEQRPVLEAFMIRHEFTGKVLMPGYVSGAERYLPLLGAYVLSSLTEGMPISILEAMAAGIPIVATAVGELPEMLNRGEAGLLVKPGDSNGLADAMERLLIDAELRERLAREARRILEERYSVAVMGRAYVDFYLEALQARSGGSRPLYLV